MAEAQAPGAGAGAQQQGQQFAIHKIYLKDMSFEAPNAPDIFRGEWKPKVNLDLGIENRQMDENTYEVILKTTVTTTLDDKTAYLCEVHQAGIFSVKGFDENTLGALLGSYCPATLFPYAREAVSDLVGKGGFPQIALAPVNFDALYMQQKQRDQQQAAPAAGTGNGAN
ncbi:MAG: protein-export chaperone SecB [Ectothiorhodospiraceae bacterium]|nr:protein-export chaperone SecB [Ectothiorhodospiraceae bacterium]MCH8504101.1 protein-export chaperone SecB [Ectothiorhodospiraceae bacterium]